MAIPLNRSTIEDRLDDLANCLTELETLANLSQEQFGNDRHNLALASFYLQRAIEDILSIGTHILARLAKAVLVAEYKDVIPELAKAGIVSQEYAKRNADLGKYRNRLVHHYLNITSQEIYNILHEHLGDIRQFGQLVHRVLERPQKYGLTVS